MPCRLNAGASHTVAPITARFSKTGVAAGTAKRFQVFRMADDKDTSDMKPM